MPRQHTDRPLKVKLEVLGKLKKGIRGVDLCREYNLRASTLSTWKRDRKKLEEMANSGKVLEIKRNCKSFLPDVERALHVWFCEMRSRKHAPPISQQMLAQKAT